MFSFYGTKRSLAERYPAPQYGRIIEPFAGAAGYAMLYPENEVILIDKDHEIVALWKYLQQASKRDILSLPDLMPGQRVSSFRSLIAPEADLLGRFASANSAHAKDTVQERGAKAWQAAKPRIAASVSLVRHWTIMEGDYFDAPDLKATWFIDPPYQSRGEWYDWSSRDINYNHLREFCLDRRGLVIACENLDNDWLPRRPKPRIISKDHQGMIQKNVEVAWIRSN